MSKIQVDSIADRAGNNLIPVADIASSVDLAAPDGAGLVGYLPAGTGAVATTVQSKLREHVSVKDFGAACDGVTDDTAALIAAVAYSQANGCKVTFAGKMLITGEVSFDRTIWLEGEGESKGEKTGTGSDGAVIIFRNTDVDGLGNATKCLFRFTNVIPYGLYNSKLRNFTVYHDSQVPKNQHTIVFDRSYIVDLVLENITVNGATGAVISLKGDGTTNYIPGFHNPRWAGIRGYNVGGLVSQTAARTWIACGDFRMFNIERNINTVSPQSIMCDFTGARNSTFSDFILEGAGSASATTALAITRRNDARARDNIINQLWIEFPTNPPIYDIDTESSLTVNGYTGSGKVRAAGYETVVEINNSSEINTTTAKFERTQGARIEVSNSYSAFYYNTDRPFVRPSEAGKIRYKDHRSASGSAYSHDYSIRVWQLDKANALTVTDNALKPINSFVSFGRIFSGHGFNCVPTLDATEGRVLRFTTASGSFDVPFVKFQIKVPTEFIGCSVVFGIRFAVNTTDVTTVVELPSLTSGAATNIGTSGTLANATKINAVVPPAGYGIYRDAFIIVNEATADVVINLVARDTTAALTVDVADIQVFFGSNLPTLRAYDSNIQTWRASAMPTAGYFVAGDVIFNTDATSSTSGWRRQTTGTNNVLGTDWRAF